MRNTFSNMIYKHSKIDKDINVLVADISIAGNMAEFQKKYPDRFINVGVAEQTMIGLAAGMALKGKKVFAYTIATFTLYRPFEMVRNDLCFQNLPVTIVGMGSGTIYSSLGPTHLTQEDISVARSIPNMQIICPSDPLELESAVKYCIKNKKGPIYLRIGKSGELNYTSKSIQRWEFGKIRKIRNGKKIAILSTGVMIKQANQVFEKLKSRGLNASIYSCHTLKPFDKIGIRKIIKKYEIILTLEDHSLIGGLGSIVKERCFDYNFRGTLFSNGLQDKFIKGYGSHEDLLRKHGVDINKISKNLLHQANKK